MIQRVQTLYLLVTILASVGLYVTAQDVELMSNNFITNTATMVSAVLSVVTIFSFKNRKKQILFNYLNILINALLIGLLVYWLLNLSGGMNFPEKGIEPIFPLVSIVCFVLANINIGRDERLVKSVDRIR